MKTYKAFNRFFKYISLTAICLLSIEISFATTRSLSIAISNPPSQLNPFFSTDANSQNINRLVHSSLTDFNDKMEFVCILCESFTEKMDGKKHIISFKLKNDLTFHDGSKITSEDVKNSWTYFTDDKKIKSIFRFAFKKIIDVVVKNDLEFDLVFENFSVENLSNLALLKILKLKDLDNVNVKTIVGAGPYTLEDIKPLEIKLKPRDQQKAKLQFKVVKDETTLALKLLNKEIDLSVSELTPRKIDWMKKNSDLSFTEKRSTNYKYISVNHKKEKFKNKEIIKAISLLIPRQSIIKYKLKGMGEVATSIYSKDFKDLYIENSPDLFNENLSSQLFIKNGYKLNKEGYWQKNNQVFELDWKSANNKATEEMANTIKTHFEKNGIRVRLTFQEWGTFLRNFKNGSYDIVMGQWIGFTGGDMIKFAFHSSSIPPKGGNRGYFINAQVDRLIDRATAENDKKTRNYYYREALNVAFNNYAYINLWHPKILWVSQKCVSGVNLYPNGNFYGLLNVENDCE